jgi:nucleotide-binding universal stress UspA family protein
MKILLPLDGSEPSLEAVRHALRLVRDGLRAEFVLANVQEPTYLYEMVLAPDAEVLERVSGAAGAHSLC